MPGVAFKDLLTAVLRRGLEVRPVRSRYHCPTFSMGVPLARLDRAIALAGVLEDEETARKLALHARARAWLESTLSAEEPVALPWAVLLGFLRLATSGRILPRPLTPEQAVGVVDSWLAQPVVEPIAPGREHWQVLRRLLAATGPAGNLTTDAHLAAIAIENGAELCSTDSDFARFPNLVWTNPLRGSGESGRWAAGGGVRDSGASSPSGRKRSGPPA